MPGRKTVLIIEDDAAIRQGLADALGGAGYDARTCRDGDEGLDAAMKIDCDLVLLDLSLPKRDGLEILAEVRRSRPTLPFIILTARSSVEQRIEGLRLGSDDYVVKPFSIHELLARIEAVLRRSPERPLDLHSINIPGGTVCLDRREVTFDDGTSSALSDRELDLLRYLAENPSRFVSREEILSRVWRINPRAIVGTRTIDMLVARLRLKLRDDPDKPGVIRTVRGKGYMLCSGEGSAQPC